MENDEWKIDFDSPDGEFCINDEYFLKDGKLSYSISKKTVDIDEYHLEEQDSTELCDTITISGVFCTEFYISDIRKIETKRYVLTDIDVTKESYGSHEDRIIYEFEAGCAQVKYQSNNALRDFE